MSSIWLRLTLRVCSYTIKHIFSTFIITPNSGSCWTLMTNWRNCDGNEMRLQLKKNIMISSSSVEYISTSSRLTQFFTLHLRLKNKMLRICYHSDPPPGMWGILQFHMWYKQKNSCSILWTKEWSWFLFVNSFLCIHRYVIQGKLYLPSSYYSNQFNLFVLET